MASRGSLLLLGIVALATVLLFFEYTSGSRVTETIHRYIGNSGFDPPTTAHTTSEASPTTSPTLARNASTIQLSQGYKVKDTIALSLSTASLAHHPKHGECLFINSSSVPVTCTSDERQHHESLIHPALLLHPYPRRALIVGGGVSASVREALKHYMLSHITWVESNEELVHAAEHLLPQKNYGYSDVLNRTTVEHMSEAGFMRFVGSTRLNYDVVIIADPPDSDDKKSLWHGTSLGDSRNQVLEAALAALEPGGIVAVNAGGFTEGTWQDRRTLRRFFPRLFLGTRYISSLENELAYMFATKSEAAPDPTLVSASFANSRLQRRTSGEMMDYDGVAHTRMFALSKALRLEVKQKDEEARKALANVISFGQTPPELLNAPYDVPAFPIVPLRPETLLREFYGCSPEKLNKATILAAVTEASATSHAPLATVEATEAVEVEGLSGTTKSDHLITVVGNTLGDTIAVLAWPRHQYVSVTITTYMNETSSGILIAELFKRLGATKVVGSTSHHGEHGLLASIEDIRYPPPISQSNKIELRESQISGSGYFAKEFIAKGETLFQRWLEPFLVTRGEVLRMPSWHVDYVRSYAEQVEDDVFAVPSSTNATSFFLLNHHCEANLRRVGYNKIVAGTDINAGQELTIDYATTSTDSDMLNIHPCKCGSPRCRKHISGNDWRNPDVQIQYGIAHFAPFIQKRILAGTSH
ncbi:S-adenosyl-L-methionine-dependent methyltransferase [Gaertneriomyces semiglobifer]|nr:S-adenosyl-L-methionine-dependent methyltransferase [Gaertneriomyces semiglobifer]